MAHYAKMEGNVVVEVIVVADENTLDENGNESEAVAIAWLRDHFGVDTNWLKTSYNTWEGQHKNGGTPFRGNYAGTGMVYNETLDVFHEVQPYPSWTLSNTTYHWEPPVPHPHDLDETDTKYYLWNEDTQQWDINTEMHPEYA